MTMTMTMTTLIEDGSIMSCASGPAGMSDGVMNPRKKSEVWLNVERYWLMGIYGNTVRRQRAETCAKVAI